MEIYVKYLGPGWYPGIPSKDMTKEEFEALSEDLQMLVRSSVLYQIIEAPRPPKKAATKEQ